MPNIDAEQMKAVLRGIQAERQAGKRRQTAAAFQKGIDSRQEAIRLLSNIGAPFTPARVTIETPFLIWVQHNYPETQNILIDSNIVPKGSWAKIYSALESEGTFAADDDLNFYFYWANSTGQDAVVNVSTFLMLDGLCNAWGNDEWLVNPWGVQAFGHAVVTVTAQLSLLEWWNHPPTTPLQQPGQRQEVVSFQHNGHWEAGGSPSVGTDESVSNNYHLTYDMFRIPNGDAAVFEVGLKIGLFGWDGHCSVDFNTDPFTIICPRVELEILTTPQSSSVSGSVV